MDPPRGGHETPPRPPPRRAGGGAAPAPPAPVPPLHPAHPRGPAPGVAGRPQTAVPPVVSRDREEARSPRAAILAAVRRNVPGPAVPLPEVPGTDRKGIKTG